MVVVTVAGGVVVVDLVALDAAAGQLEEHVVERGRAQRELAHGDARSPASATATGLMAAEPLSVAMTSSVPWTSTLAAPRAAVAAPAHTLGGVAVDPGDDHVGADRCASARRACPRRRCGRGR